MNGELLAHLAFASMSDQAVMQGRIFDVPIENGDIEAAFSKLHGARQATCAGTQTSLPPGPAFHQCCFNSHEPPVFFRVELQDRSSGKTVALPHVAKTGGDSAKLEAPGLHFVCDEFASGLSAKSQAERFFPAMVELDDLVVCRGVLCLERHVWGQDDDDA